jgi:serine/threonine protein phosphatase PrpC
MVDDASIARELGREESSDELCRGLVKKALEGGGRDNITVVVATYRRAGSSVTGSLPTSTA